MVVGLHGSFLREISTTGYFLTVNGIFKVAVPLFFIINGYYFASIQDTSQLKKWSKRIFFLYAFWMLFYSYAMVGLSTRYVVLCIVLGYFHLWYLSAMIGAGILTFLLKDRAKLGLVLACILFVLGVVIQYLGNHHVFTNHILDSLANHGFSYRNFLIIGFPCLFTGFQIKKNGLFNNISINKLRLGLFIGLCLLLAESYYSRLSEGLDTPLSLGLVCPTLFLLVIRSKLTTQNKNLALFSSAIYFIHPFCYFLLSKFGTFSSPLNVFLCILLSSLSAIIIIIQIQKRVKFIL